MFDDRVAAGRLLGRELAGLPGLHGPDVVVLGLPRGGVPVAYETAMALEAPLDVIVVRKLGVPSQPELAMGAIGEGGVQVIDARIMALAGVTDDELRAVEERERAALDERSARLRRGQPQIDLTGRVAIIVDDGIATGSTARAACRVARALGAARVVVAVPVAAADTVDRMPEADQLVCLSAPRQFVAVGAHYRDFTPTTDEQVMALLDAAARRPRPTGGRTPLPPNPAGAVNRTGEHPGADPGRQVEIPVTGGIVRGELRLPAGTSGVVLFAHGSGSSRHSPRNRFVAGVLNQAGLGTLLLDLLTPDEERDRTNVFDIALLADRLVAATRWIQEHPPTSECRIGYFGASTGAGAALWAAAEPDAPVAAIVSRGGRPDLAAPRLGAVRAPTLLIVGGADQTVLGLNRQAEARLRCTSRVVVVPGATHLFEEPGTLAEVARLAGEWFSAYLLPVTLQPAHR